MPELSWVAVDACLGEVGELYGPIERRGVKRGEERLLGRMTKPVLVPQAEWLARAVTVVAAQHEIVGAAGVHLCPSASCYHRRQWAATWR
jgi:hypothetical protein